MTIQLYVVMCVRESDCVTCTVRKYKMKKNSFDYFIQLAYIMLYNTLYKSTTKQIKKLANNNLQILQYYETIGRKRKKLPAKTGS